MISSVFVWVYNVNRGTPGERVGLTKGDKILLELHFFFEKTNFSREPEKTIYFYYRTHTHIPDNQKKKFLTPL